MTFPPLSVLIQNFIQKILHKENEEIYMRVSIFQCELIKVEVVNLLLSFLVIELKVASSQNENCFKN